MQTLLMLETKPCKRCRDWLFEIWPLFSCDKDSYIRSRLLLLVYRICAKILMLNHGGLCCMELDFKAKLWNDLIELKSYRRNSQTTVKYHMELIKVVENIMHRITKRLKWTSWVFIPGILHEGFDRQAMVGTFLHVSNWRVSVRDIWVEVALVYISVSPSSLRWYSSST